MTSLNMTPFVVRLFPVASCALLGLGIGLEYRRVSVRFRVSCHRDVSATSFKDVIDFLCFERR